MANAKQDGSNLINVEYSTGRCRTTCEQCFVNFGQQGQATCRGTVNPGHDKLLQWLDMQPDYVSPPKFSHGALPAKREWLLREIKATSKGFINMPTLGAWDSWVVKNPGKRIFDVVTGAEHLGPMPFFLRVSSMSDSSYAPIDWLDLVQNAWGDQCFFNSAIRSIQNRNILEHFHKLVVTLNPGKQTVNQFRPATSRFLAKAARTQESAMWKADIMREGKASPKGSMGPRQDLAMDFLHPVTLSMADLGRYEDIIKFYRLRALPTVRGRVETDKPVVITQMRFKSLEHAFEFCRRYKLNFQVRLPVTKFKANGDLKNDAFHKWSIKDFRLLKDNHLVRDDDIYGTELHIWSDKNDTRNASPYRGEACVYVFEGSYWRTADTDGFNTDAYVCDRLHGGCSHCGLCASLDGAGPTIDGVEFCNNLNEMQGRLLAPFPGPEGAGYLGYLSKEHMTTTGKGAKKKEKFVSAGSDLFATNLQALGVEMDVPQVLRGWAANPQETADLDDALLLLQSSADYLQKVDGPYFCEGWNTHENVETSIAFACYSIMVYAAERGDSYEKAMNLMFEVCGAASDDIDVLEGLDGIVEMWDGMSPWNDVFGPVFEEA